MMDKNCTREFYSHSCEFEQFGMNLKNRDSMIASINGNDLSGIDYSLQFTRWFLRFLGIWPLVASRPSQIDKYLAKFVLPFSSVSMIIVVFPIWWHVALNRDNRLDMLVLLGPIIFLTSNVIKHFLMILRSRTIKLCIEHMETDWRTIDNPTDNDIMMKNLRVGRGITIFFTFSMYSGVLLYHAIMPLWSGTTINEYNETVRPLAYPGTDNFINLQYGRNYEIVFYGTCVCAFFHFSVVSSICNLAAIFVCHACGQIGIVMSRLESLVGDDVNDIAITENHIGLIIQCHTRVLRFSSIINDAFREICLLDVGASTLIICLLEYYCMMEWSNSEKVAMLTYIMLLISECFNIYVFCHIGELLTEQFAEVGRASYLIEWYKLPGKTGLSLVLLIAMAHSPRKLKAGGMVELSIASFATIMKTTVAYLNMIRRVAI